MSINHEKVSPPLKNNVVHSRSLQLSFAPQSNIVYLKGKGGGGGGTVEKVKLSTN